MKPDPLYPYVNDSGTAFNGRIGPLLVAALAVLVATAAVISAALA